MLSSGLRFFCGAIMALALFAVQSPASAQSASGSSATAQYKLAPGDGIRVFVYQNADLSLELRLTESGTVSYPLLGSINLSGLTVNQAEQRIADGLRDGKFVNRPQVTVTLLQVRGNQVSILGQVNRPGRYPLETGEVRLTDIIATAGGIAVTGADSVTVVGTRNGAPYRVAVDLPGVFGVGRRGDDIIMRDGDVIWVDRLPQIYLYGEVQRPGPARLERDMTVMQALATAGGLTQRGTEKGLRIHRKAPNGEVRILEPKMTDTVQANDVVFVRESLF
ncbi:MAG: polysaccharide export protein EpsE [Rubrivivax sp.]|nr:polysaccharide export protein EpsE [Rubrivivax sp.]